MHYQRSPRTEYQSPRIEDYSKGKLGLYGWEPARNILVEKARLADIAFYDQKNKKY